MAPSTVLVLDTASPVVSLAVARQGAILASATLELRRTSERLLTTVRQLLETSGCSLAELSGVAALQGPGSFTGLRIGLATVLGWHQALGLTATAIPTLPILALASASDAPQSTEVIAAVNAMRGDWMVQRFRLSEGTGEWPTPIDAPRLLAFTALEELGTLPIVGFEMPEQTSLDLRPAQPLAPIAARLLSLSSPKTNLVTTESKTDSDAHWQSSRLMQPIYFRPPAVTLPKSKFLPKSPSSEPAPSEPQTP